MHLPSRKRPHLLIAIEGMCQVISKFVFESVKQSHYARAVECLIELRLGCVQVRAPIESALCIMVTRRMKHLSLTTI